MAVELSESRRRIITASPHIVTPAGAGLHTFKTDMSAPLKECRVNFSPVQEGTGDPAPDNVRAISGWTGINLTRCGKNLSPVAEGTDFRTYPKVNSSYYVALNHLVPSENYTVQVTITKAWETASSRRLYFHNGSASGNFINTASTVVPVTKKLTKESTADGVLYLNHNVSMINSDEYAESLTNIMVERGSEMTEYEPYNGVTIPIDWSSSAGTVYRGYVDLVEGKLTVDWDGKIADGNTTFIQYNGTFYTENFFRDDFNTLIKANTGVLCNKYKVVDNIGSASQVTGKEDMSVFNQYQYAKRLFIKDSNITTLQELYQSLNSTPLVVVYPLATPITYPIDPVTLKTLRGLNNIWSDMNGNIELSYWTH